jgi:hypothetical protein
MPGRFPGFCRTAGSRAARSESTDFFRNPEAKAGRPAKFRYIVRDFRNFWPVRSCHRRRKASVMRALPALFAVALLALLFVPPAMCADPG